MCDQKAGGGSPFSKLLNLLILGLASLCLSVPAFATEVTHLDYDGMVESEVLTDRQKIAADQYERTQARDKVIDEFFGRLKRDTLSTFHAEGTALRNLKTCLGTNKCKDYDKIKDAYKLYRHYVGVYNGHKIRNNYRNKRIGYSAQRVQIGKKKADMALFKWGKNYPQGEGEVTKIIAEMDRFDDQINKDMDGRLNTTKIHQHLTRADQKYYRLQTEAMQQQYLAMFSDLLVKHPYFAFLHKRKLTKKELKAAIDKAMKGRNKTVDHVKTLKGEGRFELLGFLPVLATTMASYTQEETENIARLFKEKQDEKTISRRIMDVVNSDLNRALVACHSFAAAAPYFRVLRHPLVLASTQGLAAACSSYGLTATTVGAWGMTKEMIRHSEYLNTQQYDERMYRDLMMSYSITMAMAGVAVRSGTPGLLSQTAGRANPLGRGRKNRMSVAHQVELYQKLKNAKAGLGQKNRWGNVAGGVSDSVLDGTMKELGKQQGEIVRGYTSFWAKDVVARDRLLSPKIVKDIVQVASKTVPFFVRDNYHGELNVFSYSELMKFARENVHKRIQAKKAVEIKEKVEEVKIEAAKQAKQIEQAAKAN